MKKKTPYERMIEGMDKDATHVWIEQRDGAYTLFRLSPMESVCEMPNRWAAEQMTAQLRKSGFDVKWETS